MLTLRYMGSSIKVDGNTEVVIPGILSIKGGEIVLDNVQVKVLTAIAGNKKSEKVISRELAIAEAIGEGIPVLTTKKSSGRQIDPNCFTQRMLAVVKPLLAKKRYDSTSLLNELEKAMPGINRQKAAQCLKMTKGVKYSQGIWSLPLSELLANNKG